MLTPLWHRFRNSQSRVPRNQNRRQPSRRLSIESLEERCLLSTDVVLQWNQAVLAAIRNDKPTIGFVTRDLAIVQTAIYDAVNAIDQTSSVFQVRAKAPADASPVAAAAAAGLFTASALFPTDTALFQATYLSALADIPDGPAKDDGIAVGRFVAEQTLISRVTDGANAFVPYTPGTNPGDWRPTPPGFAPAQTPQWPFVTPFALDSGSQFRPPPPPALTSAAYTAAFNEVKDLGRVDSTDRTAQQTEVARFWEAKAGTPQIAGYWNEIAENAATSQGNTLDQNARLFAELNVALADETIAFFDAKYTYNRWRPVTAIQLAGQDGNPDTVADPNWLPLLNTANHPSWVSAHGGISGAAAATLANSFGTDNVSFSLTSEDLKGVTHSFASFSAAAKEAENSVVWSGTHFRFDVTAGDAQGQSVARFVDRHFFKPEDRDHDRDRGRHSDAEKTKDRVFAGEDRTGDSASRLGNAADLVFALAGRSVEHQANAGRVRGFESGDRSAEPSTSATSAAKSERVSISVAEHHVSKFGRKVDALDFGEEFEAGRFG
jgi:hypothetical protein